MLKRFFTTSSSGTLTLLRVVLGVVMMAHGSQKLLGLFGGYGYEGTIGFFHGMGISTFVGTLVIIGEFFGGLGLVTGFLTRLSAAGVAAVMAGAVYMVHFPNGFFMNWFGQQAGEGYEFHLLVLAMTVMLAVRGGGWASADAWIARHLSAPHTAPAGARKRDLVASH
ncbi:MAG TPA: DoxX family protein [Candidatus Krumholzibacteria bacterium]|nr:DoxX family protein [Candidatus Krumholzibacteria bacterium]